MDAVRRGSVALRCDSSSFIGRRQAVPGKGDDNPLGCGRRADVAYRDHLFGLPAQRDNFLGVGQDIRSSIAIYAIYKAEQRTVLLIEKWRKLERQLSIVAGLLNDSRDIEAELAQSGSVSGDYVEHMLAINKLAHLWSDYCIDLMSQTDSGGKLVKFFFVEASKVWNAELKAYLDQLLLMIDRGGFWIPPILFLRFRRSLSFFRVKILEPIISKIQRKRTHRNRNPLNGGRPSDIGLQELLSKAESAGVSASELAAQLVAHGLDGKPTGGRAMRVRRETKRLATALRRLKPSSATAVPVGTKPRKAT